MKLLILLLITLTSGFCSAAGDRITTEQEPLILVLGDSLSSGYGIDADKSWVSLLGQRLMEKSFRYQLINASISGNTTINGLNQLGALLQQYKPDIVIIELGGNDGLRGLSLQSMQRNLSEMISLCHQSNARVALAGIKIPPNYGKRYTEAFYNVYPQLAKQHNVTLIPFLLDDVGDNSQLMQSDGLHPTAKAQAIILENVWPYLLGLLEK